MIDKWSQKGNFTNAHPVYCNFKQTSDLLGYYSQNFGNIQWENCCLWENATKYSAFLKTLRKDKMNPMKFMNPQNPKIKLGKNTLIYMHSH